MMSLQRGDNGLLHAVSDLGSVIPGDPEAGGHTQCGPDNAAAQLLEVLEEAHARQLDPSADVVSGAFDYSFNLVRHWPGLWAPLAFRYRSRSPTHCCGSQGQVRMPPGSRQAAC